MSKVPVPDSAWIWARYCELSDENRRTVRLLLEFLLLKQMMGNDK